MDGYAGFLLGTGGGFIACGFSVWRQRSTLYFLNILIIFNISNIDKEINKEIPEDDFIEDRNMLECFLKCFK
jgi:hypothetical protein